MSDWETALSRGGEDACVRGVPLEDVMDLDFADAIWLLYCGEPPTPSESRVFNAVLSGCIDHGVGNPSSVSARTIQSGGNDLNTSVAGGVLALGDLHGGAIEDAMRLVQRDESAASIVDRYIEAGDRLPGLGHRVYEGTDPRAEALFERAEAEGLAGEGVAKYRAIRDEFAARKARLVVNVDGAIAAIMSDLGWDWRLGKGLFIVARTPGLVAHVREEMDEPPFRRESGVYTGPEPDE
jgi:citryl-CoA lyase